MRKRLRRALIWSAVAVIAVFGGLTALGTELSNIFQYTAETLCGHTEPPAEPGGEPIYVACGDVPASAPTLTDAAPSSS
jgi:hypothetical protein